MIDPLALLGVGLSLGLLGTVLELVRRRRLAEELALVWILLAGSLLVLSLRREVLHTLARWLGIAYPPALLLLASIVLGLLALLAFTVAISRQRDQIEKLIEEVALLGEAVRRLSERESRADGSSDPARHRASSSTASTAPRNPDLRTDGSESPEGATESSPGRKPRVT